MKPASGVVERSIGARRTNGSRGSNISLGTAMTPVTTMTARSPLSTLSTLPTLSTIVTVTTDQFHVRHVISSCLIVTAGQLQRKFSNFPCPLPRSVSLTCYAFEVSHIPVSLVPRCTPSSLRAEGVLEIGRASGTSALFVLTRKKLHLLHTSTVQDRDRELDAYAVQLAVCWIENGLPSYEVAGNLDVGEPTLRRALAAAGYERLSASKQESLQHVRMAKKLGNRRGRLVLRSAD
jgi:hypothetical protein